MLADMTLEVRHAMILLDEVAVRTGPPVGSLEGGRGRDIRLAKSRRDLGAARGSGTTEAFDGGGEVFVGEVESRRRT